MTISPGPPPWPIPPTWTLSPPAPPTSRAAQEPPARTVIVLRPDGSGVRGVPDPPWPGIAVETRSLPAPAPGFAGVYGLARAVASAAEEGAYGIVVADATEAPEETAWAIDLLNVATTPVVLIGGPDRAGEVADAVAV